jgi:hypothetical protein
MFWDTTRRSWATAATYPEPVALGRMKGIVEQIPIVTDHLPDCAGINLLPANMRVAEPSRNAKAR